MTIQIQLFKPIFNREEILKQIGECLDKGWTGTGYKTIQFEEKFKEYTGIPHAHFLNSATSGLHLALELIKHRSKSESITVLTTPLTFISDTHVILHAGLYPRFVDIDGSTLCMDPSKLREELKIQDIQGGSLAVIYVGIGGNTGNLDAIIDVCDEFEVPLILDASHMMGTYYHDKHVGTQVGIDYIVFSFQSVKNLPTADSGMICCRNPADDMEVRKLSWLGISKDTYNRQFGGGNWDYNVEDIGWKYHGNSIMAAMGLAGLKILESSNSIREMQRDYYYNHLDNRHFRRITINPDCLSSNHLFQVRVDPTHRQKIIEYANRCDVQLGVHYKCHTEYEMYNETYFGVVPIAEAISKELISLPIGPHLSESDVRKVTEVLNGYSF